MGNLGYELFKEQLKERVQRELGEEISVYYTMMQKNNGSEKEALTIQQSGINMIPEIHVEPLYQRYQEVGIERCVQEVLHILRTGRTVKVEELWGTWEAMKDKIQICLINRAWNQEYLQEVVYQKYLDLAVVFRVFLFKNEYGQGSIIIKPETLEYWGITETELWETAFENLQRVLFPIRDLEEMLMEYLGVETEEKATEGMQYVISSQETLYGGSAMLRADLLRQFAEEKGCDVWILPSSVNELILIPDRGEFTKEDLVTMVQEVNRGVVMPEERLSEEVYYFSREKGEVEIAV